MNRIPNACAVRVATVLFLGTVCVLGGFPASFTGPDQASAAVRVGQQPVEEWESPPMHAGGHLVIAQPYGDFADYVSVGFGLAGFFRVPLDESELLSLRIDLGALNYGTETRRVCLVTPCLVEADLTTSNNILIGHVGPELGLQFGGRSRLYAGVGGGFGYFATTSTLENDGSSESIASTTNFSDFGFAWNAGGGAQIRVSGGRTPVWIDLGVDYQGNGQREYLTEGDIDVREDGSVVFDPRRSDADVLLFRVGVSVGLRPN